VSKLAILDGLFLPDMPAERAPKRFRKWLEEVLAPPQQKLLRLVRGAGRAHPQEASAAFGRALALGRARLGPAGGRRPHRPVRRSDATA